MDKQGEKKVKKLSKKTIIKGLVAILVLIVLGVGAFYGWQYAKTRLTAEKPPENKQVCSQEMIDRTSVAIDAGDFGAYSKEAIKLLENDDYKQDVNCSYIVARYYIQNGRKQAAKEEAERVESLINSGQKYSQAFTSEPEPADKLKAEAESIVVEGSDGQGKSYISSDELEAGDDDLSEIDKLAPNE